MKSNSLSITAFGCYTVCPPPFPSFSIMSSLCSLYYVFFFSTAFNIIFFPFVLCFSRPISFLFLISVHTYLFSLSLYYFLISFWFQRPALLCISFPSFPSILSLKCLPFIPALLLFVFLSFLLSSFSPLVLSIHFILPFLTCFSPLASASCLLSLSFLLLLRLSLPQTAHASLFFSSFLSTFLSTLLPPLSIHLSERLLSPFPLLPAQPLHPWLCYLSVVLLRLPVSPPAALSGCAGSLLCTPPWCDFNANSEQNTNGSGSPHREKGKRGRDGEGRDLQTERVRGNFHSSDFPNGEA